MSLRNTILHLVISSSFLFPLALQADIGFGLGPFQFRFGSPVHTHSYKVVPVVPVSAGIDSFDGAICYAIQNHKYIQIDMEHKVDLGNGVVEYRQVRQVVAPFVYGIDTEGKPVLRGVRIQPGEEMAIETQNQKRPASQAQEASSQSILSFQTEDGESSLQATRILRVTVLEDSYFEPSADTEINDSGLQVVNCKMR